MNACDTKFDFTEYRAVFEQGSGSYPEPFTKKELDIAFSDIEHVIIYAFEDGVKDGRLTTAAVLSDYDAVSSPLDVFKYEQIYLPIFKKLNYGEDKEFRLMIAAVYTLNRAYLRGHAPGMSEIFYQEMKSFEKPY